MVKLAYRQPRVQNLGAIVGPILTAARRYEAECMEIADDLAAFHAPSECSERAYARADFRILEAIDQAVAKSGLSRTELEAEIMARTGGRWWGWTSYSIGLSLKEV